MPSPSGKPTLREMYTNVHQDLQRLEGFTAHLLEQVQEPQRRKHLQQLLASFQTAFSDVQQAVPAAIAALDRQCAEGQDKIKACRARIEILRQRVQQSRQRKPAATPPAVPTPLHPLHGEQLRQEVLARFGDRSTPLSLPQQTGEVAAMDSTNWKATLEASEAVKPARPQPPTPSPEKTPGSDVADMSSSLWKDGEP
jgi:hypothetical protein